MTTKGIIFSAPMVRALYDGRKTQTRRLINPQPQLFETDEGLCDVGLFLDGEGRNRITTGRVITTQSVPYCPSDRLYVRESAAIASIFTDVFEVRYAAHQGASHTEFVERIPVAKVGTPPAKWAYSTWPKYRRSIHMPRVWSRLWLNVINVRVQRLQDITEADALAEGCSNKRPDPTDDVLTIRPTNGARLNYAELWNALHTDEGTRWQDNPWIVAITFATHHGNIDGDLAGGAQ
ncbi:hypothetical protein [Novosphingobium sp.]|uniref:hypothetical protein n=1 Tax=Novosphingobium sp. TaxID=1874826 RepID=UPI00262D0C94|nr:hypothetical protein [Novosphingobium sp.]